MWVQLKRDVNGPGFKAFLSKEIEDPLVMEEVGLALQVLAHSLLGQATVMIAEHNEKGG